MQRLLERVVVVLICLTAVVLIALQIKPFGWLLLAASFGLLITCRRDFIKHIGLVLLSLGLLGLAPIDTDIKTIPALTMASTLLSALMLPYLVTKYLYKDTSIRFSFHHGRKWYKSELGYIAVTAIAAYLILPFYLSSTGAYLNWPNPQDTGDIFRLFIGTNALGIWDELFFICVILSLLRRHLKFWQANAVQAVLFTSFLYELGFVAWAFIPIYIFALLQGYIFSKTESLFYVITIHLTLDLVLFLALLNAHHPEWVPIFIT